MPDQVDESSPEPIELRRFDLHNLWRVLLWGSSAAMALAVVAGTAYSDLGADRLKQVVASLIEPARIEPQPPQLTPPPPQVTPQQLAALERQTRELTQTVRELTTERDRFKARLASVEQNLEDITGAVKRQATQRVTQETPTTTPKETPKSAAAPSPPPAVNAPQTVIATPSPSTPIVAPDAPTTTASTPPAMEAAPPIDGPIPLPPTRLAGTDPATTKLDDARREFGVDLGGAASLDALRAHWAALKANVGPDLVGLAPAYTIRQRPTGGTDYRLVLGPIPNSAAALRLCTKLAASRVYCRAGTFSVQQFAERQQETPRPPAQLPGRSLDSIMSR